MILTQLLITKLSFHVDASSLRKEKKSESSLKKSSKTGATDAGTSGPCGLTQVKIHENDVFWWVPICHCPNSFPFFLLWYRFNISPIPTWLMVKNYKVTQHPM